MHKSFKGHQQIKLTNWTKLFQQNAEISDSDTKHLILSSNDKNTF